MTRTLLLAILAVVGLALLAPLAYAHDDLHAHPRLADAAFALLVGVTLAAIAFERRYSSNL